MKILMAMLPILLAAASTSAVTLEITQGFVVDHVSTFGSDVFWSISGDGFFFREEFPLVEGSNACNCPSFRAFISGVVILGDFYVPDPAFGTLPNVILDVASSLIPLPAPLPSQGEMTLTGTIHVLDPTTGAPITFELIGQGIHFIEWPRANDSANPIIRAEGVFFGRVAEPSASLLLATVAFFALVTSWISGALKRSSR